MLRLKNSTPRLARILAACLLIALYVGWAAGVVASHVGLSVGVVASHVGLSVGAVALMLLLIPT